MENVKSDGSLGDKIEKGVVFIGLPLMITMLLDLAALKVSPANFRAAAQQESIFLHHRFFQLKLWKTLFRSSMKALVGGNKILFR